jgi:STIP1 family protein 1
VVNAFVQITQGNKHFTRRNYKEAIEQYSKAIEVSPNQGVYYTNRALCHLKLKQWTSVIEDCKRAIEIDNNSIKGYFYLGQALFEQEKYDDSIVYLKRSYDLTKIQNENYGDEITRTIRHAKRTRWNKFEEKRVIQEIELQSYLEKLMLEDKMRRIDAINANKHTKTEQSNSEDRVQSTCCSSSLSLFRPVSNITHCLLFIKSRMPHDWTSTRTIPMNSTKRRRHSSRCRHR